MSTACAASWHDHRRPFCTCGEEDRVGVIPYVQLGDREHGMAAIHYRTDQGRLAHLSIYHWTMQTWLELDDLSDQAFETVREEVVRAGLPWPH